MGWPSTLNTRPSVDRADGHADRPAGVDGLGAARQAVGGGHGDGAHPVIAEVLLDLADERLRRRRSISTALKMAGSCPAGNSMSTTGPVMAMTRTGGRSALGGCGDSHVNYRSSSAKTRSAPVAISIISRVMLAWRTLL